MLVHMELVKLSSHIQEVPLNYRVHLCHLSCVCICGFELVKSFYFFLGSLEPKYL